MEEKTEIGKYVVVQDFMFKNLGLKSSELLIYAIIFGVCQTGQPYRNGISYLMYWTNCTKQGVIKILKSLVDKGHIIKNEYKINNIKYCEYYATILGKQSLPLGVKSLPPSKQSLPPQKDTQPNYINNNIYNYNSSNNNIEEIKEIENNKLFSSKKERNFTKPTLEEIRQYLYETNSSIDAEYFYNYYESNGWKVGKNSMKNWKACIKTWERKQQLNNKSKQEVIYERI